MRDSSTNGKRAVECRQPTPASTGNSDDGTVRSWEATTGKATRVLAGHLGAVQGIAWSPAGDQIVSVSAKPPSQLIVWDLTAK